MSEEQRHNCSANKDIKTLSQFAPSNKLAKTSQRDKSSRSGASSSRRPVSGAEGDQSRQQERLGADALETLARRSEGRTAGEKLATMILCARRKVDLRRSRAQRCSAPAGSRAARRLGSGARSWSAPLVCQTLAAGLLLLLVCLLASTDEQQQQPQQPQEALADLSVAASNNYDNQHQQLGPGKAKKIQIVYIKVPLAKLRPSLGANSAADYNSAQQQHGSNYSATAKLEQQQQYETTDSKSAPGSQQASAASNSNAGDELQQQLSERDIASIEQHHLGQQSGRSAGSPARHQPQSFLIPMALVQTSSSDAIEAPPVERHEQQQQQQQHINSAGSQLHAAHSPAPATASGHEPRSPMQMYRQQQQQQLSNAASNAIAQGFMSSFLSGEKDKMTAAAARLQSHLALQQLVAPSASQLLRSTLTAPSLANQSPTNFQQQQQQPPPSVPTLVNAQHPKGPGGLMPPIMMPYSRMPDNAIGQAYGAAVGSALPAESGSPASLLASSSSYANQNSNGSNNNNGYQRNNASATNSGGASGTAGMDAYSSGTGSSTSFGTEPQGHSGASYSANNFPNSMRDSAASGASSGYGSGPTTSGASTPFSDYPRGHSQASSNNNNIYHQHQFNSPSQAHFGQTQATMVSVGAGGSGGSHEHSQQQQQQQQQQPLDGYSTAARLKQAKKTIIPIVVQVEHAVLENGGHQQQQSANKANKYASTSGGRSYRQLGGKRGFRGHKENKGSQIYGAATNEVAHFGDIPPGAQFVNAANMHDINQITAQINAENAASAAAALAQADASFGPGMPPIYGNAMGAGKMRPQHGNGNHHQHHHQQQHHSSGAGAQYLQSAASALLANTHPVIQAAASGGIASVSKLGAKLGEIMALPSMQVPNSIAQIGSSLPSALSSLTNTMGSQLAQSVQQVAKEHPVASSFARQIAHQAGIQLPQQLFANGPQQQQQLSGSGGGGGGGGSNAHASNPQHHNQVQAASSNQQLQQAAMSSPMALQNLKLSIGQNLQSAAAQLMGVNQKANSFAQTAGLLNGVGGTAGQVAALSAALKQFSSVSPVAAQLANQLAGVSQSMSAAASSTQAQAVAAPPSMGALGSGGVAPLSAPIVAGQPLRPGAASQLVEQFISAAAANAPIQIPANIQQQMLSHILQQQQVAVGAGSPGDSAALEPATGSASSGPGAKPAKAGFKSKFMSFFQPPKFISNLLSWNDRADERNDEGFVESAADSASGKNATTTTTTTTAAGTSTTAAAAAAAAAAPITTTTTAKDSSEPKATSLAPSTSAGPTAASPTTTTNGVQQAATKLTTVAAHLAPSTTKTSTASPMSVPQSTVSPAATIANSKEVPKSAQQAGTNSTTSHTGGSKLEKVKWA